MKKLLLGILLLVMVSGCTGLNVNVAANVASDLAFTLVLQNNPTYKPIVSKGLQDIKAFLVGTVTYDDLILQISKVFDGKYAYIGVILSGYIEADTPIFQTYQPLLDSYKAGVIKKLDRFILLVSI